MNGTAPANPMIATGRKIIIHTQEGLISDSIEFEIEGCPRIAIKNDQASWMMVHFKAMLDGGVVRHHNWDGTYTETEWLLSAPYQHRQFWLNDAYAGFLTRVEN